MTKGSDLPVVMGGYGHSHLREMFVGGTTRDILEHMTARIVLTLKDDDAFRSTSLG